MVESEDIKEANMEAKIKELELQDAKVLQAQLPFAEKAAKKHLEAKQATKQAAIATGNKPRYEFDDNLDAETRNRQAAESEQFLKSFRSGFY